MDYIIRAETVRTQMDCNILHESEFEEIIAMKAFIVCGSMDRVGRPIYFLRIENFDPTKVTEQQLVRFFCWQLDRIAVQMKPNVDQYIMVYDFNNAGYSNFSVNHAKLLMPFLQTVYC